MLIFWSCSQGVRAYQQVKDTCLVRPDSSVVRAFGICLDGPGSNPQSGHLFCLTTRVEMMRERKKGSHHRPLHLCDM
jgi:hypothetical protein